MIFFSLRFAEAHRHATLLKQAIEAELKEKVYLCSVPEGQSIADDIAENLKNARLVVIFGTATYGTKTDSSFSTYQEMIYVMDKKKPFFLIKMCKDFVEPLTEFYFNSTISYFEWDPASERLPVDLVSRIEFKLKTLEKKDEGATRRTSIFGRRASKANGDSKPVQQHFTGYVVGQRVYCDYMRLGTEKLATIVRINPDKTYDVEYDDDDEFENKVDISRLRAQPFTFNVKDKVMVDFMNKGTYFPAEIVLLNDDSTYDVVYLHDTRLFENKVSPDRIRAQTVFETGAEKYFVGQSVFVNWLNQGTEYKGIIEKIHENGTYDIKYFDGDFEKDVPPSRIRPDLFGFVKDEEVMLTTGGKARVTEVFLDGTYALKHESGEIIERCPPSIMRKIDAPEGTYKVGQYVLVNWKGYGKEYYATITKVNNDGTYDVLFDDDSIEEGVQPDRIRDMKEQPRGRVPLNKGEKVEVGTRVDCNWQNQGTYYSATITQVHSDGTLDVAYDDGDTETRVQPEQILLVA